MLRRSRLLAACVVGRQRVARLCLPSNAPAFCIDESTRVPTRPQMPKQGLCRDRDALKQNLLNLDPRLLHSAPVTGFPLSPLSHCWVLQGGGGQEPSPCLLPGTSCPVRAFSPHIFTQSLQLAKPQRLHQPAAGSGSPAQGGANTSKEGLGWRQMANGSPLQLSQAVIKAVCSGKA